MTYKFAADILSASDLSRNFSHHIPTKETGIFKSYVQCGGEIVRGMELPESSFRRCYSTYIRLASFCLHIRSNILEREIDPTPNNINGVWNIRNSFDR